MTIRFDPDRRRSTHVESGLAVQWVRDEPPVDRSTHFKLIVGAVYDCGEHKSSAISDYHERALGEA